ncbi:MAG: FAD-dependent thymidylate synthase [Chloroflexota bacterium]
MTERFPRRIYLLSPRHLSPETIAVAFAKTSRSPLSFDEIAAELTDQASAQFHDRWVVGYGHASVAEHAVLHIAFENVSRLAIEAIESARLASYTEKSTRYQKWDPGSYAVAPEIAGTKQEALYRHTCDELFAAYLSSLEPVRSHVQRLAPRREGESDEKWDGRIRSRYVDACRFLLPAAALANVGMTANARVLERTIRKLLSHPLQEVRDIGDALRRTAQAEVPTLLKYADSSEYLRRSAASVEWRGEAIRSDVLRPGVRLIAYDPQAESRLLAAALFTSAGGSFEDCLQHILALDPDRLKALADEVLGGMGRFDVPARLIEHSTCTVEVILDQGAYLELKRHRMMTQTPQRLTVELGFAVPRLISLAGLEPVYRQAMDAARRAYHELAGWNPDVASYVVPNAFNRRVLLTLNLREAYHFCELRSAANAHFSMRRIALQLAEEIRRVHPLLAGYMRLPEDADWRAVEAEHFTQV